MQIIEGEKVHTFLFNANLLNKCRVATHADDFGDEATVGLRVKKRKSFDEFQDHDFGIFLGKQEGKFCIGTCVIMDFVPNRISLYDSSEEMHRDWQLD